MLKECPDPDYLVPDPDTETSDEINTERISVATAFANCRELNHEKVIYIKGTGGK